MSHRIVEPGLIEVVYESAEDMKPEKQLGVRAALDEQLEAGPVALVFCVRKVLSVDMNVPAYWAEVARRLSPRLCALGIASSSMAVRAAARAFAVGNTLRRVEVDVEAFSDEAAALGWAREKRRALPGR